MLPFCFYISSNFHLNFVVVVVSLYVKSHVSISTKKGNSFYKMFCKVINGFAEGLSDLIPLNLTNKFIIDLCPFALLIKRL